MKLIHLNALLISLVISANAFSDTLVNTIAKIKPSVVGVGTYTPTGRPQNILAGTGFVIGDGSYVVTNHHVVPLILDEQLLQQLVVFVGTGMQPEMRQAKVIASSDYYDIAILKIDGEPLPALTLSQQEYSMEGQEIAFTGFPIGAILGLYPVTHRGIISSISPVVIPVDRSKDLSLKMLKRLRNPYLIYQLDATAYPGNSGSAVFDMQTGEVIAIINKVFVKETKEAVIEKPSGITYAIPIKHLHELLKESNLKITQ